jgi:hypothetical protein
MDQSWLEAGFTSADYDRIKVWGALGVTPQDAFAWEKAGFVPSYKDSKTERVKSSQNMQEDKIYGLEPNAWTQSGVTQEELGEALKSGIPASRAAAVKPATVKRLRDFGAPPNEWRYYLNSSSPNAKNYDFAAIKRLNAMGLSGEKINEWRREKRQTQNGFSQEEAILWREAGIKESSEAAEAEKSGYSPKIYGAIKTTGVSQEDWSYCINNGLAVKAAKAWEDVGVQCSRTTPKSYVDAKLTPAQVKPWVAAGFGSASTIAFIKNGFGAEEARSWLRAFQNDVLSVSEITEWRKAAFSPAEAQKWRALTRNVNVARGYKNANLSPNRIARFLIDNGVPPSAAASEYRRINSACGDSFALDYAFLTRAGASQGDISRFEATGKCVIPSGFNRVRTVEKGVALYRISDERRAKANYEIDGYALVNFGGETLSNLNNNIVLKPEDTTYQPQIGTVFNAKVIWKK